MAQKLYAYQLAGKLIRVMVRHANVEMRNRESGCRTDH